MPKEHKKSPKDIYIFIVACAQWLKDNVQEGKKTKFQFALEAEDKIARDILKDYEKQKEKINIKHCATDEDGVILRTDPTKQNPEGNYRFTKEGQEKRDAEIERLFETPVAIEPYYCEDIPKLNDLQLKAFTGFVIRPADTSAHSPVERVLHADADDDTSSNGTPVLGQRQGKKRSSAIIEA